MTAGSKLSFPCGTRAWKQKMLVSSAGPRQGAGRAGRSPTMEALFVPGDRKNSDLRVSVHFLFLSFIRRFFSVSSFDYAGRKSKLFWKHYLAGFRWLRIDIKISLFSTYSTDQKENFIIIAVMKEGSFCLKSFKSFVLNKVCSHILFIKCFSRKLNTYE